MDLFDDYQNEMERLTDDEIEIILSGGDHASRHLTTLIRDVRHSLLENPIPEIAVRHLAAMASARSEGLHPVGAPAATFGRRRLIPRRRLTAIALAAALLFLAGIAAAVTLPKRADQPAPETVSSRTPSVPPTGEDLPEEAAHGQAVADIAKDPSLTGCEKGQAVADAASAKAAENRKNPAESEDPCSRAGTKGKSNSGRRGDAPAGPGGVSRGRGSSHSAGDAGSANAPGLGGEEPGVRGSEARAAGGQGAIKATSSGGAGGGGGVPIELPTP